MVNITALLSTLITANHILSYHDVLDAFGHISVRNSNTNTTFFIALQLGPAVVSGLADIGEYLISDGSPVNGTKGGYAERYIHSEILKRYPDINAVVHSHAEDVLPYTVIDTQLKPVYHMAGFLGASVPNFDIESAYQDSDPRDMLVNSPRLGAALAETFGVNETQPTSPLHTTILQRGHGFVTVGDGIEQVTDFAYYAASNARVQTKAVLLANAGGGSVQYLSQQETRATTDMNKWIVFKPWKQWVREVERSGRPFTNKVRLVLQIKQIPFLYVPVPSMLPRPLLTSTFALHYRKIPVLAIGREIYCDTSLIIEALEHFFPAVQGWGTVYPKVEGVDGWMYRGLVRGFTSFWTDKPLFRATTGLIPPSVWSTDFGKDRAQLIGHALSPAKLGSKINQNLSNLDLHLSLLEPMFGSGTWAIPTNTPSLADISLYYQLRWGIDIAAGRGISNLSGGETHDTQEDVMGQVFSQERYPGLWRWFHAFEAYMDAIPDLQTTVPESDTRWKDALRRTPLLSDNDLLVPTAVGQHRPLDVRGGLLPGVSVKIAPDDTGRNNPTSGTLVKMGVEEVVIMPNGKAELDVRVHFPRLGFLIKVVEGSKL
ncbi:Glutathione s-transferase like protein [Pyrenophora tritici-repentis]|nr:Glutathione s-transferase protein [Pyrenophora tritici-repentis]KAI0575829.1 Glutathione s-transferase like protein [Pyrenophora tritici-repentis]KAI0610908.1 Glutathione s-transferase like protein [Pyrenophora tritici-repentis]KAI0627668.1 Glutathione s-transferase like protein [Pyrenophora tritici-repentis]